MGLDCLLVVLFVGAWGSVSGRVIACDKVHKSDYRVLSSSEGMPANDVNDGMNRE